MTPEWLLEHANLHVNEVVVMYAGPSCLHSSCTFPTHPLLRDVPACICHRPHLATPALPLLGRYLAAVGIDDGLSIQRPTATPIVDPLCGILSLYSFFMLSDGVVAARSYSCWCSACSRVRGRGEGTVSEGMYMNVPGCTRVYLTRWQERSRIVVRAGCGQRERDKRQADVWARLRTKIAPGKFAAVQARELWSTSEEVHHPPTRAPLGV